MHLEKNKVVLDPKITISKLASGMLEVMKVKAEEDPREYGVYDNVKLQIFHATYFAYRPTCNGGYGRLASKAEVFRSNEPLEEWMTWDHMKDQAVPLNRVPNPNIMPKRAKE